MESFLSTILNHCTREKFVAKGFTLIELIVCLAIIGILLGVVLLGQSTFNRSLILTDTAYTIAISVRQMESYGLSSLHYTNSSGTSFANLGYGVHFDSALPNQYIEMVDTDSSVVGAGNPGWCPAGTPNTPDAHPGNCVYNGTDEKLALFTINSGYYLRDLCGIQVGNRTPICTSAQGNGTLDIVFLRPNTEAVLTGTNTTNGGHYQLTSACIFLSTPDGSTTKMIRVTNLGQVTVTDNATCT